MHKANPVALHVFFGCMQAAMECDTTTTAMVDANAALLERFAAPELPKAFDYLDAEILQILVAIESDEAYIPLMMPGEPIRTVRLSPPGLSVTSRTGEVRGQSCQALSMRSAKPYTQPLGVTWS